MTDAVIHYARASVAQSQIATAVAILEQAQHALAATTGCEHSAAALLEGLQSVRIGGARLAGTLRTMGRLL